MKLRLDLVQPGSVARLPNQLLIASSSGPGFFRPLPIANDLSMVAHFALQLAWAPISRRACRNPDASRETLLAQQGRLDPGHIQQFSMARSRMGDKRETGPELPGRCIRACTPLGIDLVVEL